MRGTMLHAWARAWHEFTLSLRSSQDQTYYVVGAAVVVGFLYFNRDNRVEEWGITYAAAALPGILAMIAAVGFTMGPMYTIAMEREDGTVLRLRNAPRGLAVYMTAQVFYNLLGALPMLVVLLVPSVVLLGAGSSHGLVGWLGALGFFLLGLLVLLPLGIAIGCLVPDARRVTMWGLLPVVIMMILSGIFNPIQNLWGWLQPVAQALPIYWLGHGLRGSLLPDAAAGAEVGGDWRVLLAIVVLAAWAAAALMLARFALRHVATHQSGSVVARMRDEVAQGAVR